MWFNQIVDLFHRRCPLPRKAGRFDNRKIFAFSVKLLKRSHSPCDVLRENIGDEKVNLICLDQIPRYRRLLD